MLHSKGSEELQGSANRKKEDKEVRNSGGRKVPSVTTQLYDPHSFNAYEASKYLNDLWVSVNEREPQAVYKDSEKAWGAGGKGAGGSTPFLAATTSEFLADLQRSYAKLSAVSYILRWGCFKTFDFLDILVQ